MIPAFSLIWKYRRLATIILGAAAISVLAYRVHAWREGYLKLDQTRQQLADERKAHAESLGKVAKVIEQSEKDRAKLAADLEAIRAKFANIPPPKTVVVTKEVPIAPGQTTCPVPRISGDWRLFYNAASIP